MAARPALCAGAVSSFVCSRFIPGLLSSAQVAGRRDREESNNSSCTSSLNHLHSTLSPSLHPRGRFGWSSGLPTACRGSLPGGYS